MTKSMAEFERLVLLVEDVWARLKAFDAEAEAERRALLAMHEKAHAPARERLRQEWLRLQERLQKVCPHDGQETFADTCDVCGALLTEEKERAEE